MSGRQNQDYYDGSGLEISSEAERVRSKGLMGDEGIFFKGLWKQAGIEVDKAQESWLCLR